MKSMEFSLRDTQALGPDVTFLCQAHVQRLPLHDLSWEAGSPSLAKDLETL